MSVIRKIVYLINDSFFAIISIILLALTVILSALGGGLLYLGYALIKVQNFINNNLYFSFKKGD